MSMRRSFLKTIRECSGSEGALIKDKVAAVAGAEIEAEHKSNMLGQCRDLPSSPRPLFPLLPSREGQGSRHCPHPIHRGSGEAVDTRRAVVAAGVVLVVVAAGRIASHGG
jgi:hypothetical protein